MSTGWCGSRSTPRYSRTIASSGTGSGVDRISRNGASRPARPARSCRSSVRAASSLSTLRAVHLLAERRRSPSVPAPGRHGCWRSVGVWEREVVRGRGGRRLGVRRPAVRRGVARAAGQHGGRESEGEEAHPAILARAGRREGRRRRLWGTTPSAGFPRYVGGGSRSPPARGVRGAVTEPGSRRHGRRLGGTGGCVARSVAGTGVAREPHGHPGAAARRGARGDGAGVPLDDLVHDGQAEARARHRARLASSGRSARTRAAGRPGSMPGPWSSTVSTPLASRTVIVPSAGPHLAALSSRLVTARSTAPGLADDPPGQGGHVELAARRAQPDPRDGPVDHLGEVEGLDHVGGQRLVAGQLDEVADEGGQLLELGADVVEQLGLLLGGQPAGLVGLGEQVEVGAQRGERRAQLVAGVGDQPALPVARGRQRRRASR